MPVIYAAIYLRYFSWAVYVFRGDGCQFAAGLYCLVDSEVKVDVLNQSLIEEPKDSFGYGELTLTIDSFTRTILDLAEDYCAGGTLGISLGWRGDLRSSGQILGEEGELFEMLDHCLFDYC